MPKGFRYDINALRAIAVLAVIAFHYTPALCPAGFAGVDVFFVISGYLMSKIIIGGLSTNSFSLLQFYQKRIIRIIPALLLLLLIITLACFFLYLPKDYQLNEKNATASILFISNITYQHRLSYFDPVSNRNMFLHTWSLSVEWQFYLLYPLALMGMAKVIKGHAAFLKVFIAVTVLLFAGAVVYTNYNPSASFYFLQSRCWEMLVGGVAYLLENKIKPKPVSKWTAIAGYVLITLSFFVFKNSTPWPGLATLLPVLATFMVIVSNYNSGRLLHYKFVRFFGLISYSLYLWHWPVLVMAEYLSLPLGLLSTGILFVISTILATLSYAYVEKAKPGYKTTLVAAAALFAFTIGLSRSMVNGFIFKPKTLKIANYASEKKEISKQFGQSGCFIDTEDSSITVFKKERCLNIQKGKQNILLIGDSHAADLSQPLSEALERRDIHLLQTTSIGCLPLLNTGGHTGCDTLISYIYKDFIPKNAGKLDGVILSGNWMNAGVHNEAMLLNQLAETISFLKKHKLKILIIGQNELYLVPYRIVAAREYEYGINLRQYAVNQDAYYMDTFLMTQLKPYYVDIYNIDAVPALSKNGIPYMFDENHFSIYGAEVTSRKILSNGVTKAFLRTGNKAN